MTAKHTPAPFAIQTDLTTAGSLLVALSLAPEENGKTVLRLDAQDYVDLEHILQAYDLLLEACEAAFPALVNAECYCWPHDPCARCLALEKVETAINITKARGNEVKG